jgi:uncharacterized protein YcfL
MKRRELILILVVLTGFILATGCSQTTQQNSRNQSVVVATNAVTQAPGGMITPADLTLG